MNNYIYAPYVSPASELYHHGIKGQKWGVRKYQNEDGSLTPAGRKRYGVGERIHQAYVSFLNKRANAPTLQVDNADAYRKSLHFTADHDYKKGLKKAKAERDSAKKRGDTEANAKFKEQKAQLKAARKEFKERAGAKAYENLSNTDIALNAIKKIGVGTLVANIGTGIYSSGESAAAKAIGGFMMVGGSVSGWQGIAQTVRSLSNREKARKLNEKR